jgi:hypothetical protein
MEGRSLLRGGGLAGSCMPHFLPCMWVQVGGQVRVCGVVVVVFLCTPFFCRCL